jgi:hypothetical protein
MPTTTSWIAGLILLIALGRVIYIFVERGKDDVSDTRWRRNWLEVAFLFVGAIVVGVLSFWIQF